MPFITDKQTLTDLNLLGKYKTGSMFNLFNNVRTRGGELLLEEMFRTPLTDAASVNARAARIRYVQSLAIGLEINRDLAEQASGYLTGSRPGGRLASLFHCYLQRMEEMVYRSEQYQLHQRRIYAVQEVLLAASTLLGWLIKHEKADNPCKDLQQSLDRIVNAPGLRQLQAKYPYTVGQVACCEYLFRNKFRRELEELLHILYEFDVYISVAQVAENRRMTYAHAVGDGGLLIEAEDLRHPALAGAVGNDIGLGAGQSLLFLTGANMAGKSTWMKTLGVSFYLGHMGFPVAARRMSFRVMEGLFTSINVPDDISNGWSHFYAEVMRVKDVASQLSHGKRLFVLFDELFKGTNVKDAFDATLAVTQKLARYRNCAFIISTHITEVGEALAGEPNVLFRYMPTAMEGVVPRYTYRLRKGITEDRHGMMIIRNERILELLTNP